MNVNPNYSAAYVVLKTDGEHEGHGLTFTIGRGNELCVAAIEALKQLAMGLTIDSGVDMGAIWKQLTSDSHLRWVGPEKGVIHLDLKPGNILIGLYDGKPVPKVIDFGVAKATGSRLTDQTIYTEVGSLVGTLEYMSPEQAELNNLDIDTRSDIYALGVLLYELLTGSVPFARKEMVKAGLGEMLRVIKEVEPPKPSTKLSGSGTLPSIAANRHTEPAKLTRLVKGDLDWIVMKALEKDRNRRYETANGFAADVQRYLSGEAVTAVPPSAGYRLRKFVKRNKGTVVAASLILVTLLSGFIVSSYAFYRADINRQQAEGAQKSALEQWKRAEDQKANALRSAEREAEERKKADAAKVEAQAKEAEANAVVAFFENKVFAAARPKGQEGGLGAGVTLRDAIAASVPSLDKVFAAQPMVEARLRMALGNTFRYLAEYEQARAQDERARALYTRHRGPEHWDTLHSMNNLANSLRALNRHADALKLREETLAIQTRVLPRDHPATLLSMQNLANNYNALNRHADAIKLYEETLAIMKRVLPPEYPGTLKGMNNLSVSYAAVNRQADALKLREEVLAIQKRVLPKDHPDTLLSMHNLANSYGALNRPAEALKLREETLAIQKRVLPPDHPDTLLSMNNLADSYAGLNRHAEALKLHKETLAIRQRVLPQDHPDTLLSMLNLANSLIQLDRGAEALPLLDEFLAKAPASPALDPRQIPRAFSLRIRYFQKTGDAAGCRATAEMRETLNRTDADSLYDAACYRAVTGVVQVRRPGVDSARLAREDADRAMQWLHKAVRAGHKDTALMKKDHDLDSLREREDFKKLLAELENGAEKK